VPDSDLGQTLFAGGMSSEAIALGLGRLGFGLRQAQLPQSEMS
jgi:hypothetical protein